MQKIVLDHVTKYFGQNKAVNDAHITIGEGEFFTLLGPSGCGKTTLLRTIAGFYKQEEGNLYFGDRLINDVPTHNRDIGMVFQNYAIFPHMTVFENVAYGLKARKVKKKEIEERVMEALQMVELSHLRDRVPSNMSGGQQQRIALARAIVIRPSLLLMDEPLSNLDAKLRIKMRSDIRKLQKELNITTIYVTHDQEEALAVSDRIAVLSDGIVQQIGRPHEIYSYPRNRFVASFIGTTNFVRGTISRPNAAASEGTIELLRTSYQTPLTVPYEGEALISVRPENVRISLSRQNGSDLEGRVKSVTYLGEKISYAIELADGQTIEATEYAIAPHLMHQEAQRVYVDLQLAKAVIFDSTGKEVVYSANSIAAKSGLETA
ncbi:ABC transporter ATP-binding protein [Cohnella sp. 56]|uniref:ABC transporter ATP-binding protein n=1 Tax=Cohnella sp. 56 TaxID=3113722 RepID=UPI0030E910FF